MRVLLVEDSESVTQLLSTLLRQVYPDADVNRTCDLKHAADEARDFYYDVVILNLSANDSAEGKRIIESFAPIMDTVDTLVVTVVPDRTLANIAHTHGAESIAKSQVNANTLKVFIDYMMLRRSLMESLDKQLEAARDLRRKATAAAKHIAAGGSNANN